MLVGDGDTLPPVTRKIWNERADARSLNVDVAAFEKPGRTAEDVRGAVRDTVAAQLEKYPTSLIRIMNIFEVRPCATIQ